jgi:leader peptidase (prepilin peptidase) / N-methyltransferase
MLELDHPIVVLAVAPFVGSFLGVLIQRLPSYGDVVFARSNCPHCARQLAGRDLVPVLSWLSTGGRCRTCRQRLGLFYPAIELAAVAVAAWASVAVPDALLWPSCLLGWLLLALAVTDYETFLLPDALTYAAIVMGLGIAAVTESGALVDRILGALSGFICFALTTVLYRRLRGRDGLGLGDAKLLAGIGAWVSWEGLPSVVLIGAVSALLFVAVMMRRQPGFSGEMRIPFGTFLAIGGWIVWLYGPLGIS